MLKIYQHPAISILSGLRRLRTWGVAVGPSGMHLHFGAPQAIPPQVQGPVQAPGRYSLWVRCPFHISLRDRPQYRSTFPNDSDLSTVRNAVEGQRVLRVAVDPLDSSLRLLYPRGTLFSAFPGPSKGSLCWIAYDHSTQPAFSVAVHTDGFSGEWPSYSRSDLPAE
jgi:hypothetical protein